ncbi:unnamed protein product [Rodentolepis nana]|uniref:phosphoglucomutase (alpha-D-glucose-1,6-bisphosphate-dependent) n=1 Tax=Rodentolepis nana TaxID=102285 RepID=A0A0R3T2Z5_RODNA|nr:unnamed protein product [Rodentolepis nana]
MLINYVQPECKEQVRGFTGAIFRKFYTISEAEKFLNDDGPVSPARKRAYTTAHLEEEPLLKASRKRVVDSTAVDNLSPLPFMHDLHEANKVLVYTDGSCKGPQNNRRAGIGVFWGENHPWNVSDRLSGRQTNNRAEIEACIRALQQANKVGITGVKIVTDSKFTINCATIWYFKWIKNDWKLANGAPVLLKADIQRLADELASPGLRVSWCHSPGHRGKWGNEQADKLANQGANLPCPQNGKQDEIIQVSEDADYDSMSTTFTVQKRETKPFEGQKPGTSGLRKPTKTFMQPNYVENFVQACLSVAQKYRKPKTKFRLVLGGDGRYFLKEALLNAIIPICAANGVEEVMVGEEGILSTPAVSTIIRRYGMTGAIIMTASHNPGGIDGDFGLKYNIENGGPATETITNEIYEITKSISEYHTLESPIPIDLSKQGTSEYALSNGNTFKVQIISSTKDYVDYMKEIFDFDLIKGFLNGSNGKPPFKILVDGLSGVTGPYIKALLMDNFNLPESSTLDCTPLPDFGGHHPDPNLTYASKLVDAVRADKTIMLAAAFDGDGDRNMIIGQNGFFVCPCDSLAVIADNAGYIKYFSKNPPKGFARSMPTSPAVDRSKPQIKNLISFSLDRVCKAKNMGIFETPTGWKFFGNLLDADKASVCGEESFGTGSNHIREKDGIWALLCWLSILAGRQEAGKSPQVRDVLREHWSKYGRDFFTRYDYENCTDDQGKQVMDRVKCLLTDKEFVGRTYTTNVGAAFKVLSIDDFCYKDPIDHSVSKNQVRSVLSSCTREMVSIINLNTKPARSGFGIRIMLSGDTRIVYRMSGTGSSGATIRVYVNTFSSDPNTHDIPATSYMAPHIELALGLCGIQYFTGRTQPTVIT